MDTSLGIADGHPGLTDCQCVYFMNKQHCRDMHSIGSGEFNTNAMIFGQSTGTSGRSVFSGLVGFVLLTKTILNKIGHYQLASLLLKALVSL